jgi:hypothetical protein
MNWQENKYHVPSHDLPANPVPRIIFYGFSQEQPSKADRFCATRSRTLCGNSTYVVIQDAGWHCSPHNVGGVKHCGLTTALIHSSMLGKLLLLDPGKCAADADAEPKSPDRKHQPYPGLDGPEHLPLSK